MDQKAIDWTLEKHQKKEKRKIKERDERGHRSFIFDIKRHFKIKDELEENLCLKDRIMQYKSHLKQD